MSMLPVYQLRLSYLMLIERNKNANLVCVDMFMNQAECQYSLITLRIFTQVRQTLNTIAVVCNIYYIVGDCVTTLGYNYRTTYDS